MRRVVHLADAGSGCAQGPPSGSPVWGVTFSRLSVPMNAGRTMFRPTSDARRQYAICGQHASKGFILTNVDATVTCKRCLRLMP